MTTLIEQALDEESWAVGAQVQLKNVHIAPVHFKGQTPRLQLHARCHLLTRIPFAPGVYRGTGQENRLSLLMDVPANVIEQLERIEAILIQKAREHVPLVESLWNSCVKNTPFGKQVKVKLNADGAYNMQLYNEAGEPISIPLEDLQRRNVLQILSIRGIYAQRGMCGLMVDVAAMMCGERPPATAPKIESI